MSDWQSYSLSEIADIRISNVDKKSKPGENPVQLCNYMDVYSNDYITINLEFMGSTASSVECTKFKVDEGDVLITKDSETPYDIGIPSVVIDKIEDLVCGYHLALIKPNREVINSVFLSKQLATADVSSYFSRMVAGSTRYGLSNGAIAKTKVSIPSLAKQQKVAEVLFNIDQTIEKTEALIEKYQHIKAGLMHDLFTRGIGADGKLRPPREQAPELYQQTPIGWIPKEWQFDSLKNIFGAKNIVNGPFGSDLLTSELKKEGVPVLYCQDIKPGAFVRVSKSNVTLIKAAQLSFCNVRKNDVLLAKVGSPPCDSCVYFEDQNAIVTQDVIRIRPSAEHGAEFFSSWFNSGYGRKAIKKISIEGTRERVSLGDFKELIVPLPNNIEQQEIGRRISHAQNLIALEKRNLKKHKQKKSGLMHDLLTGKVTIKTDQPEALPTPAL